MLVLFLRIGAVIIWDILHVRLIQDGAEASINAGRAVRVIEQGLTVDGEAGKELIVRNITALQVGIVVVEITLAAGILSANREEVVTTTMLIGGEKDGEKMGTVAVETVKYVDMEKKNSFKTVEIVAGAIIIDAQETPDKDGISEEDVMMVVVGLAVMMIEGTGQIGRVVVQPVMVAGVTIARATLAIEGEPSTTGVAREAAVIIIPPPKMNMSRTVEETTGPTTTVVQAVIVREDTSIGAVRVLLATPGMSGEMSKIVAQPVMVAGVTTARATLVTEEEPSTTEVVQEVLVITILPPKMNMSRTVEETTGPTTTDVLVNTDREDTSIGAVQVLLATPGMSGERFRTAAQPAMVPGLTTAQVMMFGENALSTIEVVQEVLVITILPPKMNMSRTALLVPGPIIAPAMTSGDKEPLVLVLEGVVLVPPKMNFIRTVERTIVRVGAATIVKTMTSTARERAIVEAVQELLAMTIPIKRKKKSRSVVQVIGLTSTSAKVIGVKGNG